MNGRIKGLDGLRAIAVGLVILTHNFYFKFHLNTGGSGVRLFFVLSGFLIISILHRQRAAVEAGGSSLGAELRRFYANRFFRIWPAYYVTLVFAFVTEGMRTGQPVDVASWVANLLFLGNAMMAYVWFDWRQVGVLWSVAVEEQFYLLAGFGFMLASARWHSSICCAAFLASVLAAAVTVASVASPSHSTFSINVGSFTNFGFIALGGVTALKMKGGAWTKYAAAPALLVYLTGAVVGFPSWCSGPLFFVPGLFIPVVLVGIAQNQSSWLVKVLDLPPMRYVGRISYGLYLFHMFVGFYLLPNITIFDNHAGYKAIFATAVAVALAALSWHYFEQPVLSYRDRRRTNVTVKVMARPAE